MTQAKNGVVVVPLTALVPRDQAAGYTENMNSTGTATGKISLPPMRAFVYSNGAAVSKNVEVGIVQDQNAESDGWSHAGG